MTTTRLWTMTILLLAAAAAGCSSDDAVVAPASPAADTAPPAAPTGLQAADGGLRVKLAWNPNATDVDLAGYRVYRLAFGESYLLTQQLLSEARFIDARPLGMPCGYAVSAVDAAGNESAVTEVRYTPVPREPDRRAD